MGGTLQLSVTAYDAAGAVVTGGKFQWSVNRPSSASVSANGLVTGLVPDIVLVTAVETASGASTSEVVDVLPPQAHSVAVTPPFTLLEPGQSVALQAAAFGRDGASMPGARVTWSAMSPAANPVSATGTVTAAAPGITRVMATADRGADTAVVAAMAPGVLLATAFAENTARATPRAGETVTVRVMLDMRRASASGNLGSAQLEVGYDPAVLQFVSATTGITGAGAAHVATPGTLRVAVAATEPQGTGQLTLATAVFRVAAGTAAGTRGALSLRFTTPVNDVALRPYGTVLAVDGRLRVAP
jgi:hypothetical protein